MSVMRQTMESQPDQLRRLIADLGPVEKGATKLEGRKITIVGIGTSWHAAHHGAAFFKAAGIDARVLQSPDLLQTPPELTEDDVVIVLSHTGTRQFTNDARELVASTGASTLQISGLGVDTADILTVDQDKSAAFTVSHTGAMLRLAQLAIALGAELGPVDDIPDALQSVIDEPGPLAPLPNRLIEFIGAGPNQWTAAEGALKIREAAFCASEGQSVEQYLHGPHVCLGKDDVLVALDGGGRFRERQEALSEATLAAGAQVYVSRQDGLGEGLSVFPLTVVVQRIALEAAERLNTNPDTAAFDMPGHEKFRDLAL